jgi:hypothetical protein
MLPKSACPKQCFVHREMRSALKDAGKGQPQWKSVDCYGHVTSPLGYLLSCHSLKPEPYPILIFCQSLLDDKTPLDRVGIDGVTSMVAVAPPDCTGSPRHSALGAGRLGPWQGHGQSLSPTSSPETGWICRYSMLMSSALLGRQSFWPAPCVARALP